MNILPGKSQVILNYEEFVALEKLMVALDKFIDDPAIIHNFDELRIAKQNFQLSLASTLDNRST